MLLDDNFAGVVGNDVNEPKLVLYFFWGVSIFCVGIVIVVKNSARTLPPNGSVLDKDFAPIFLNFPSRPNIFAFVSRREFVCPQCPDSKRETLDMATCVTSLWSALCKALRQGSRTAVERSNLAGTQEESKSEEGRQAAAPLPRDPMELNHTQSTVLVVSFGAFALKGRALAEGRAIKEAFAGTPTQVFECQSDRLAETLDEVCAQHARVAVHLVGHHCTLDEGSQRRQPQCETMIIFAHSQHAAELRVKRVSAGMSTQQLIDIMNKHQLEFVFCNASKTAHLADKLKCYAFGWQSACVEQAAALLAALFYQELANGLHCDAAFKAAGRQIASPKEQRACFELIDPSNLNDIEHTMPNKLIWHSSKSPDLQPSAELLEGAKSDAKGDRSPPEANPRESKRPRVSSSSSNPGAPIFDAQTVAVIQAELTDVCLSPSESLFEYISCFIEGDGTFELSPESSLPAGVPFSNSRLPEPFLRGALAAPKLITPDAPAFHNSQPTQLPESKQNTKNHAYKLTDLMGIGVKKAEKLKKQGIHTVEALANVDIENIELAKACTGNRRYDEAQQTLSRWREVARKHLESRHVHTN